VAHKTVLNQPQKPRNTHMEIVPPDPLDLFKEPGSRPTPSVPAEMNPDSVIPQPIHRSNKPCFLTVDEDQARKLKEDLRKDMRQKRLMMVLNQKRSPVKRHSSHQHEALNLHIQPQSELFQQETEDVFKISPQMMCTESQTDQTTPTDLPLQLLKSQDLLDQKRGEIRDLYVKLDKE